MTKLFWLEPEHAAAFQPLMLADAYRQFISGVARAIGMKKDDTPAGALVVQTGEEDEARVLSVGVAKQYRRQGIGTELFVELRRQLSKEGQIRRIVAESTRQEETEDALFGLLEKVADDITFGPAGCFRTTLGEVRQTAVLRGGRPAENLYSYGRLRPSVRKGLYLEPLVLDDLMESGQMEEKMSCAFVEDNTIDSCLLFMKEEAALSLAWARTSSAFPARIIRLFQYALEQSDAYDDAYPLYIPVLNRESERLVMKLLGKSAIRIETGYHAVLSLDEEERRGTGETDRFEETLSEEGLYIRGSLDWYENK